MSWQFFTRFILMTISAIRIGRAEPQFMVRPTDTRAVVGSTAFIYCVIARTDGEVQWTQNKFALGVDRNLPGYPRYSMVGNVSSATGCGPGCITGEYTLRIEDVQLSDEGQYQCQVGATTSWPHGLRSDAVTLTAMVAPQPPVIVNGPVVEVKAGRRVNFTCQVNGGHPIPNVAWTTSWNTIAASSVKTTHVFWPDGKRSNVTSVLTVEAVREDSGHVYECRTVNGAMEDWLTTRTQLQVLYAPIITMNIQPSKELREKDTAYFTCFPTANPSDVTWKWYLGSQLLPGQTSHTYVISTVTRQMNGNILECEAQNSEGSTIHGTSLDVQYAPAFASAASYVVASLKDSATMSCDADSNPSPSIIWYRPDTGKIIGNSQDLLVVSLKPADFGLYICIATTLNFPSASHQHYIFETVPPKFVSNASQETCIGCIGQVTCEIYGYPRPNYTSWTKDGKMITNTSRYREIFDVIPTGLRVTLMIAGVKETDLGIYNCSATNAFGTSFHLITLHSSALIPLDAIAIGSSIGIVLVLVVITISVCIWSQRSRRKGEETLEAGVGVGTLENMQNQTLMDSKENVFDNGISAWKRNVYGPMDLMTSDSHEHSCDTIGPLRQCLCRGGGSDKSSATENLLDVTIASGHEADVSAASYNVQKSTLKQYVRVKQRNGSLNDASSSSGSHHSRSLSPASSDQRDDDFDVRCGGGQMSAIGEQDSDTESGVYYIEQEQHVGSERTDDFGQNNNMLAFDARRLSVNNGDSRLPYYAANGGAQTMRAITPVLSEMSVPHPGRLPSPAVWKDTLDDSRSGLLLPRKADTVMSEDQRQALLNDFRTEAMAYRPASVAGNRINQSIDSPSPALSSAYKQGILSRSKTYQPRSNNVPRSVTFRLPETYNTLQKSAMSASENCLVSETSQTPQFLRPALDSTPLATEV